MLVDVKQVQFAAQLAVVTLFRLLQHVQVLLQLVLGGPSRAVDALQHLVAMIAAPIGASDLHQLEVLELAGAGHVRAAAQILKRPFAVERHVFIARNTGNDFGLVMLTQALEIGHRLIAWQHAARDRLILGRQLRHALFNGLQILRRERALDAEVVIKAVLDHRADRHLRLGEELLHRIGQQVGRRVADQLQAFCVLRRDDGQRRVLIDEVAGVHHLRRIALPQLAAQRGLGQAGANRLGHLSHRDRRRILAPGAIWQRDLNHDNNLYRILKVPSEDGARLTWMTKKRGTRRAFAIYSRANY